MANRTITVEDIKKYFAYSNEIADLESTLYESEDQLSQEEFKINHVVASQNKVRFDDDGKDLFREQIEKVIKILADNYKDFGFEYGMYFDLVYNLLLFGDERLERLIKDENVEVMFSEIGISDSIQQKVKALLEHEEEVKQMLGKREELEE